VIRAAVRARTTRPSLVVTRSLTALGLLVALVWALVGCGSDTPSSSSASSSPTPTTSVACADIAALEDSLESLEQVDVQQDGLPALTTAIGAVKSDLAAASTSASAMLQPQLQEVTTAFDALQTATSGLTTQNVVARAPDIAAALRKLTTATTDLTTAAQQTCPSS
jgi:hypothetical protein